MFWTIIVYTQVFLYGFSVSYPLKNLFSNPKKLCFHPLKISFSYPLKIFVSPMIIFGPTYFLMCMVRYLLMALSGMKVQVMQLRVCQMDKTPGESTSSSDTPAVCFISWQKTSDWRSSMSKHFWRISWTCLMGSARLS